MSVKQISHLPKRGEGPPTPVFSMNGPSRMANLVSSYFFSSFIAPMSSFMAGFIIDMECIAPPATGTMA